MHKQPEQSQPKEDPKAARGQVIMFHDPGLAEWDAQGLAAAGCFRVLDEATGAVTRVICPHDPDDEHINYAIEADQRYRASIRVTGGAPLACNADSFPADASAEGIPRPPFPPQRTPA